ncbi:hypothetical protein ACVR05_01165 [Streptococcus caprae]
MKPLRETPWMGVITPLGIGSFASFIGLCLMFLLEDTEAYGHFWLGLPFLVIGLIFLSFAHYRYRENREMYEALYLAHPEVKSDWEILRTGATYADTGLGIWIYKNFLVARVSGLRVYDLKEVKWLYEHQLGWRRVSIERSMMVGVQQRGRHFLKQLLFVQTRDIDAQLALLFKHIEENYPHIMLGYTAANNQFFGILREEDKKKPKRFWDFLF